MKIHKLKLSKNMFIFLSLIVIGSGLFYWYEWRPSEIRKKCNGIAVEDAKRIFAKKAEMDSSKQEAAGREMYSKDDYTFAYGKCLASKGL